MKSLMTKYALSALTITLATSTLALAKKDGHPSEDAEAKLAAYILSSVSDNFEGENVLYECKTITAQKGKFSNGSATEVKNYLFSSVANRMGLKMANADGLTSVQYFVLENPNSRSEYYSVTRPDSQDMKFYGKVVGNTIAFEITIDKSKSLATIPTGEPGSESGSISLNLASGNDFPRSTLHPENENEVTFAYLLCTQR